MKPASIVDWAFSIGMLAVFISFAFIMFSYGIRILMGGIL